MAEYRALRERYSLLELCRTPDLATEVTLQPVRRIEVDAAILFSDLLLPLEPMGVRFDFVKGEGPAIENPLRSESDLASVRRFEPRETGGGQSGVLGRRGRQDFGKAVRTVVHVRTRCDGRSGNPGVAAVALAMTIERASYSCASLISIQ